MSAVLERISKRYEALAAVAPVHRIRTRDQYDAAVESLNVLLDGGAADEAHPLAELVHLIGERIEAYESRELPLPPSTGIDALRFLMAQHGLRQSDLPEIGTQGVVSEILSGRRDLRTSHIRFLAERFGVPGDVFL